MFKRILLTALTFYTAACLCGAGASAAPPGSDAEARSILGCPRENPTAYIDPDMPVVALTFDDGPNGSRTENILDILTQYGARATFFLSGCRINEAQYDVMARILESGCEIGNHTFSHAQLTKLSKKDILWEIETTNDLIYAATGVRPTLLRPPYGAYNDAVLEAGYPVVNWTIDTGDWLHQDPKRTFNAVRDNVFDGCIILMHDMFPPTAEACAYIIPWLQEQGYQLVTVSEMFKVKGETLSAGHIYRCWR